MISFGNLFNYFSVLFLVIILTIICLLYFRGKRNKIIHNFIYGILLLSFILHFVKLTFAPYSGYFPISLRTITFENISAVNTMLFPWFYISKNRLLKDYMVVTGILGGLSAIILPFQSVGFDKLTLDIARFYICHFILFLAPFLMVSKEGYKFNIKNTFNIPFVFYGILVLIFANEVILVALGLNGDFTTLFNPSIRNYALIFGPNKVMSHYSWIYDPFVPNLFKTIPFGANAGKERYWPLIWMLIPTYIGGIVVHFFLRITSKLNIIKNV